MKRYSITAHKVIAILSFLILCSVQFFLLYNTYELKNEHYYLSELSTLNTAYTNAVANDVVMPGGRKIVDHYINAHMAALEDLYNKNDPAFDTLSHRMCDSIFHDLRKANNMDSLLDRMLTVNHLRKPMEYALLVSRLDIAFKANHYINLYRSGRRYPLIDSVLQQSEGIRIGGTLGSVSPQNMASAYVVGINLDHTSRISFALHVDIPNRAAAIFGLMMPTFLLVVLSILMVVLLYFITLRNWLRQKQLSEMKSDFINSITHELHTPLSAIIVANKTMQNEKVIASRESLQPLTEVIQRQAERLKTLISQVLDITTMNRITLEKQDLYLHHLLDEILLDYRLKLSGADVTLHLQMDAKKQELEADPFWFTTILLNILDNAIKYNDKEHKEISVLTYEDTRSLYMQIRDNGKGMSREAQRHVFEKFYRIGASGNASVKGLGLGLFYVKQAIDAHGWEIGLVSTEGEGSTFTITIPL